MRQYIGARYVPRFLGTYDNTQAYEALDVVDNGMGTSYIAKKPTPANTPLTDTDYWFVYGASSGAIINLQNQIDGLTKEGVTPEMYGAIGDGVTDDTTAVQSAIDSGHPVILISSYAVTSVINITAPTQILGMGGEIVAGATNPVFNVVSTHDVIFRDVVFREGNQLIYIEDVENLLIDHCSFYECGYCVIVKTTHYLYNAIIQNCYIEDAKHDFVELNSTTALCKNISVLNNVYTGSYNYPSTATENRFFGSTNVEKVLIEGNYATNVNGDSIIHIEGHCKEMIINNNHFGDQNGYGVIFTGLNNGEDGDVTITNNVFKMSALGAVPVFDIGSNGHRNQDFIITNNTFINCLLFSGICKTYLFASNKLIDSITYLRGRERIFDNEIIINDSSLVPIESKYGSPTDVVIRNNTIANGNAMSIYCKRIGGGSLVTNVIICDNVTSGGIYIQNAKNCLMRNNYVKSDTVKFETVDYVAVDSTCDDNYLNGVLIP